MNDHSTTQPQGVRDRATNLRVQRAEGEAGITCDIFANFHLNFFKIQSKKGVKGFSDEREASAGVCGNS